MIEWGLKSLVNCLWQSWLERHSWQHLESHSWQSSVPFITVKPKAKVAQISVAKSKEGPFATTSAALVEQISVRDCQLGDQREVQKHTTVETNQILDLPVLLLLHYHRKWVSELQSHGTFGCITSNDCVDHHGGRHISAGAAATSCWNLSVVPLTDCASQQLGAWQSRIEKCSLTQALHHCDYPHWSNNFLLLGLSDFKPF